MYYDSHFLKRVAVFPYAMRPKVEGICILTKAKISDTVGARIPNAFRFRMVNGVRFMVPTIQNPNYD